MEKIHRPRVSYRHLCCYLLFVGDNDAGKSARLVVFQQLAYRALYNIITSTGLLEVSKRDR
jgi:hypothetical protein